MGRKISSRIKGAIDVLSRGYDSAEDSRFRTTNAWNRSLPMQEDMLIGAMDRQRVRLECWDLYRNNEIGKAIGDRFSEYAIWQGIRPQAQTSSAAWNDAAESWWNEIYIPT